MDKGLELKKLSEVVKALEDGFKIQEKHKKSTKNNWVDSLLIKDLTLSEIQKKMGLVDFRIKPEPPKITIHSNWYEDKFVFGKWYYNSQGLKTHRITFELDPETNQPICESVKMEEIEKE